MDPAALEAAIRDKFSTGIVHARHISILGRNLKPKWRRGISVPADEIRCWLEESQTMFSDLLAGGASSALLEDAIREKIRRAGFNAAVLIPVAEWLGPKLRSGIIGAADEIQCALEAVEEMLSDVRKAAVSSKDDNRKQHRRKRGVLNLSCDIDTGFVWP